EGPNIIVRDRPVVSQAVHCPGPEVIGPEPEGNPAPMIGTATQHPSPPPAEAIALGDGVWLARNLPASDAAIELPERTFAGRCATPGRLVGPGEHRRVRSAVPAAAGFEQHHVRAGLGEHIGRHPAARPRAYDAHIVISAHRSSDVTRLPCS